LLDFRYNTQEEIDKLNEEMTTTDEIEEIKNDSNKEKNLEGKDEKIIKEKDEQEAESNLEADLE
jgi:hypothetical protein